MQASEGYDRDLGKYESLVIRQPLQRIETAKTEIENYISLGFVKKIDFLSRRTRAQYIYNKKYECWLAFNKTDTSGKIAAYLDNLKNERYVSKLYIADFLTSHSITKLVEDNKEYLSRSHELTRILWFDLAMYAESARECNRKVASIPLMQAFYAKLYDYYKTATDSERDAIIRYFYFFNINTTVSRLIDDEIPWHECYNLSIIPPPLLLNNISLQNLTSFKNGLKTYLKKTRLDGYFFSRNFLELNIYMRDLRVQEFKHLKAYTLFDLLSDIGGSMGLLIGASVITLFEAVDACAIAWVSRQDKKKRLRRSSSHSSIASSKV
ncbi:hypothetical protein NP493_144g03026 [Ridgeia piscesae]|uniref:Uncharacterized protein n=1 Tax=Ridgeia piscesae TaxID=27915 RepID=A0AAD9P506_RIDPI|nr:hypothetical protein NP493_144g03026 [Ridgeia piscesae]